MKTGLKKANRVRWFQWEYWSTGSYYWPMWFYGLWLALKHRNLCFFTAINPGIHAGGLGWESKMDTMRLIPASHCPKTVYVAPGTSAQTIQEQLLEAGIGYPLIAKPDIGFRGMLVHKHDNWESLWQILGNHPIPYLVQEYITLPEEVGVFYYRYPGDKKGVISSITTKEFLSVSGDGRCRVLELMEQKPRALLQIERLQRENPALLNYIPAAGEYVLLGVIGNHSKGTRFIDSRHEIDDALLAQFDALSSQIPGFNYGRFDIKCESLDQLRKTGACKILEINGSCAEPTHIYDAQRMSYPRALQSILQHWRVISEIAYRNHHEFGVPYMSLKTVLSEMRRMKKYKEQVAILEQR